MPDEVALKIAAAILLTEAISDDHSDRDTFIRWLRGILSDELDHETEQQSAF